MGRDRQLVARRLLAQVVQRQVEETQGGLALSEPSVCVGDQGAIPRLARAVVNVARELTCLVHDRRGLALAVGSKRRDDDDVEDVEPESFPGTYAEQLVRELHRAIVPLELQVELSLA